ncbi:MAG: hypothetical protein ABIN24_05130 [Dyadobacter sp.]
MSIEDFYQFKDKLSKELTQFHGRSVSDGDVMTALFLLYADHEDMEWIGDVWDIDISFEQSLAALSNFDFAMLTQQQIAVAVEGIPAEFVMNKKVRFKVNGSIWIIHKNDADPFPSNPHAHHAELNQKLDLSNGNCYDKKRLIFKIPRRSFWLSEKRRKKCSKANYRI